MLNVARVMSYAVLVGLEGLLSRNLISSRDNGNEVLERSEV